MYVCKSICRAKGKGKGLSIGCLHKRRLVNKRFTILEVAANWHGLVVPRRGICSHPHCPW